MFSMSLMTLFWQQEVCWSCYPYTSKIKEVETGVNNRKNKTKGSL